MENFFYSYWWLLFPIGFGVFAVFDRWLAYKRSRDQLDLLRAYTAQGKDPPPELLQALRRRDYDYGDDEGDVDDGPASAYAPYDRYGRRASRHYWRMRRWSSPYWAWRSAITTGAVAAGFWLASEFAVIPGLDWPFRLVAIIMTCVAVGQGLTAALTLAFRRK